MCKKENGIYNLEESIKSYLNTIKTSIAFNTGFKGADYHIGGINKGDFVVLGGVLGIGKTSFALSAAYNIALSGGKVCWFSTYETKEMIVSRLLSQLTRKKRIQLPRMVVDPKQIDELICKLKKFREIKDRFLICDHPLMSVGSIARCLDSNNQPDLVVIDNLYSIEKERDAFVDELYDLAKSRNIAVMLTVNLKYDPLLAREGHKPRISDLARVSEYAVNLADTIIFLHRDCWWTMNDPNHTGEDDDIIVARSRRGEVATIPAKFDRECRRWDEKD